MEDNFLNLPDNFRQDVLEKIFKAVDHSESLTLISPPGMGKTLLLQLISKKIKDAIYLDLNANFEAKTYVERVIILDHAENLTKPGYEKQSLYFKSIRESDRNRTSFIFAISGDVVLAGPLKTVMLENVIYLEPLNSADAMAFLQKMENLYKGKLTPAQKEEILSLSGRVPRIIKRLCKLFMDKIDAATDLKLQSDLEEIDIFLKNNPQMKWDIPLLVKKTAGQERVNQVESKEALSKQEFLLAKLLIENKGKMVTREEMIEAVWKSKMYDVNEHALDQMLHRLRKKMENATPKCKLITYRGRGCKLEVI